MKIAVLIYGRLNKCVEHYANTIESIGQEHEIDFFLSSDNSDENLLQQFIELYKPISYINDKIEYSIDLTNYPGKRVETNIHNMICHFINKERVFSLLEEHTEKEKVNYDIVLSLRIDLVFKDIFLFTNTNNNTIYIPLGNDWAGGINDQIAYGNINVMRKYNNIFKYVIVLLDEFFSIPHPESLTLANITYHNLEISRFYLEYYIDRY